MAKPKYSIKTSATPDENFVQILRGKREVLYWDIQEWIDEPDLVIAIANAVALAMKDPEMMDIKLKELGILE